MAPMTGMFVVVDMLNPPQASKRGKIRDLIRGPIESHISFEVDYSVGGLGDYSEVVGNHEHCLVFFVAEVI